MDRRDALTSTRVSFREATGSNAPPLSPEEKQRIASKGSALLIAIFATLAVVGSGALYGLHKIEVD